MKEHWLWKSERRLKWWLDILFTVNHEDSKVLIKGQLIECKRGQSVRSLDTWAKEWNVTKKTVKDFFELLQKDSMLIYESIQISTRITVCNYDIYQDQVNAKETKSKRRVNGEETVTTPKQECKEGIKNEENEEKRKADFEIFRLKYPGIKKGFQTEYDNFIKKHKDWKEIIPILSTSLLNQIRVRSEMKAKKQFVPEWKMLQTWLNQRCWEEEPGTENKESEFVIKQTTLKADAR